jgi:hypothetical protein
MRKLFTLLTLSALCLYAPCLYAQKDTARTQADTTYSQKDTTDDMPAAKSYLKVGLNFLSNSVFLGRPDSVNTPTLSPRLSYTLKSGFYLSGSLDIITNRDKNKLDGGDLEVGYNYTQDDNFEWGASFTKLFFNSTSTQVSASLSSELNAYADYDVAGIITPGISLSYNFGRNGDKGDFLISPSLSQDFLIKSIFSDNDKVLISLQATLNAGSQNFYSGYLERKGKLNRKGIVTAYNNYYDALGSLSLLDYELTAPIVYICGKFNFSFIPTFAFAQDSLPNTTAGEKLITAQIEKSQPFKSSVFYFETGISFKF